MPGEVLQAARQRLQTYEQQSFSPLQADLFAAGTTPSRSPLSATIEENITHPIIEELAQIDIDSLSPRDALQLLYEIRDRAREI